MTNINRIVLTGNLTVDPELRQPPRGNSLCRLRVACNTRRRQPDGTWGEKANYFDVVVWGAQGEAASRTLSKGSPVAIDGRLEWREWTTDAGEKRNAVEIVAENVQFLSTRRTESARSSANPDESRPVAPDDDIPF
jgi:single-strand DNA-binding protein